MSTYKKRTATCGELRKSYAGKTVTLTGWVDKRRDLGGLIFIDLRDRYGKTQIVFSPERHAGAHEIAKSLRAEYVISVTGLVNIRPKETENLEIATGEVEVDINELTILNKAETPPFSLDEYVDINEDLLLKYRYLDLRRPSMQQNTDYEAQYVSGR